MLEAEDSEEDNELEELSIVVATVVEIASGVGVEVTEAGIIPVLVNTVFN